VFGRFDDGSTLAIEIDRAYKAWSLAKLRHAAQTGSSALWLRWDGTPPPYRHGEVQVLDLTMARSFATQPLTTRDARKRRIDPAVEPAGAKG